MLKNLAIYSLTAAMFGASSLAVAHTTFRDPVQTVYSSNGSGTIKTQVGTNNAIIIGHGCGSASNATPLPVIAQRLVFPNTTDSIWKKADGSVINRATAAFEDQVIDPAATLLPIAPGLVQDKSVFAAMKETANASQLVGAHASPNVRAFAMWGGNLQTDLTGAIPFRLSAVTFVGCAKSLKVRVAIANWCKTSAMVVANPADRDRRADFWLGTTTSTKFNDPKVVSMADPAVQGSTDFWPAITIVRDLTANPYKDAQGNALDCTGKEFDATVEPSGADIDANLPFTTPGGVAFPIGKKL